MKLPRLRQALALSLSLVAATATTSCMVPMYPNGEHHHSSNNARYVGQHDDHHSDRDRDHARRSYSNSSGSQWSQGPSITIRP